MKHALMTSAALVAAVSLFSPGMARAQDTPTITAEPAPAPDTMPPPAPAIPKIKPKPRPKLVKSAVQPWVGSWTGTLQQVGRAQGFPIEVTLTAKGGETGYPGQNCAGKLAKLGSNADYATFVETITTGKFDPGTKAGCLDGSLTLQRSADGIVMTWMTGYEGKVIVAYGALAPKPK